MGTGPVMKDRERRLRRFPGKGEEVTTAGKGEEVTTVQERERR